jgi:acetyl esterase/lipase
VRNAWSRSMTTLAALAVSVSLASTAAAAPRVEPNVVYGMYSGLALLLDVHIPERPNGYGVLFISGSGWSAPLGYGATPLKQQQIPEWGPALLDAGYTVFAINHRASPRFHYPDQLEDVQRAIRFIRRNAAKYAINPDRIGGVGGSSGGHLIGLAATLGAPGVADDPDPVNRVSAGLQAIVLRAAPVDLTGVAAGSAYGGAAVVGFLNRLPVPGADDRSLFKTASPLTHVTKASPPALLVHGDKDDIVPFQQSEAMEAALRKAGVPVELVRVAGGVHGHTFASGNTPHAQFSDVLARTVAWLDRHLRR